MRVCSSRRDVRGIHIWGYCRGASTLVTQGLQSQAAAPHHPHHLLSVCGHGTVSTTLLNDFQPQFNWPFSKRAIDMVKQ